MLINKAVLHILDFNSGVSVFSQEELNFAEESIQVFIEKHLEHVLGDANQQSGSLTTSSPFASGLNQYRDGQLSLIDFSTQVAQFLYEQILSSDKTDPLDCLFVDFSEGDRRSLAMLLLNSKIAYTHQVIKESGTIRNEIIQHYAILPNVTQKVDAYFVVDFTSGELGFVDKKRTLNGEEVLVLPELLLQCSAQASPKRVLKEVQKITEKVAEEHGVNPTMALSKAKTYLMENAEVSDSLSLAAMAEEVFADSAPMRQEFTAQVQQAQLPPQLSVAPALAVRTSKNHKIKTDTGIEITFPSEYFENPEYIEFINNPDGTISIAIKNIGKIINR